MLINEQSNSTNFDAQLLSDISEHRHSKVISALQRDGNLHRARDNSGSTLLHFATADGNHVILKHLIAMGADVNAQDQFGLTPLMLTLKKNRMWTMKILLDANADIHISDCDGASSLELVLRDAATSWKVLRLFFNVVKRDCESVEQIVKILSKANCPLYHAIHWGNTRVTRSRLEAVSDVDCCDPRNGKTALHVAVRLSDLANVKLLLEHGADVNAGDSNERTPLSHFNASNGSHENIDVLRLLVDRGARLYKCDWYGRMQIYTILKHGVRSVVRALLQCGIRLSRKDENGHTAVHYLAENANEGVIEELEGKKFKVNVCDDCKCAPLHLAACAGILTNINFLLDRGANVNKANRNHLTPLFYAVMTLTSSRSEMESKKECIELLLQRGADVQYNGDGTLTIFDTIQSFSNYALSKPILLHLVVQEMLGTPITKATLDKINSDDYFQRHLNLYRRLLRAMQKSTVYRSVTLFKFVAESDRQIARYARNRNVVMRLMRMNTKRTASNHCKEYLRKRVAKAFRMAQSKQQAAIAVHNVIKLRQSCYYSVVVDRIVEYLNDEDVRNLISVRENAN